MNDTSFAINNEGGLVFDYYFEDSDQLDGANVYNGQLSTLWVNFKQAFPDKIKETYQDLRSNSILNYEELEDQFITHGSDKWSESIYNEDGDFKYVSMLRSNNDATNLPQVRGTGEEHFRYFIENRLNYCDSKWYAGSYISRYDESLGENVNNFVTVRIYTPVDETGSPRTDLAIPANASITLTPYSHMYAGVRYKANGTLYQERLEANETYTFVAPDEIFTDTETAIYGAPQLSSLGDLAPLYLGYIDISAATKLVELKIGDGTPGYKNTNLYHLAVGTNRLLKKIDIQNCDSPRFQQALVLTGCPNIEEVYAKGSSITGVDLPDSGYLKVLQLPATISNLTLKNQLYIEDFSMEGYNSLKTVQCENCPSIDTLTVLNNAPNVERVRLTNVDWEWDDASVLYELIERDIAGIDENGVNTDTMWIDGKCKIKNITGAEFAEIKRLYPYLELSYETLTSNLIFMSDDGETELHRQVVLNEGNGVDPVANGTIETPTKESTAQYHFIYSGWSTTPGGDAEFNALTAVAGDRIVYAAYTKAIRSYTVNFYNGSTLLETDIVEYGKDAVYNSATPVKEGYTTNEFEFIGWKPEPTNIQGDTNCYAQYYDLREITDNWSTIALNALVENPVSKYDIGAWKPIYIDATELPNSFYEGSVVIFGGEIHLLGGYGDPTGHYKFDGVSWTQVSQLPYEFIWGKAIVWNEEIHILGGHANPFNRNHYKFNGNTWVSVSTLPHILYKTCSVIYNDELHILGGGNDNTRNFHYKFNGSTWESVSTLPAKIMEVDANIIDNKICINHSSGLMFWDGAKWTTNTSKAPGNVNGGCTVLYNGELHALGSNNASYTRYHSKWNGTSWEQLPNLPLAFAQGDAVVYNDCIYIVGAQSEGISAFYKFDGTSWDAINYMDKIIVEVADGNHDELIDNTTRWVDVSPSTYRFSPYDNKVFSYNNKIYYQSQQYGIGCIDTVAKTHVIISVPIKYTYSINLCLHKNGLHVFAATAYASAAQHLIYNLDTEEWADLGACPVYPAYTKVYSYGEKLYAFGGHNSTEIFVYDGETWSKSNLRLPYQNQAYGCVYNNQFHWLVSKGTAPTHTSFHYTFNEDGFTQICEIPFNVVGAHMVVYKDALHLYGSYNDKTIHHEFDGSKWVPCEDKLPYDMKGMAVVDNELYSVSDKVCKFVEPGWEQQINLPVGLWHNSPVVYQNNLHCLRDTSHYIYDDNEWTTLDVPAPYSTGGHKLVVFNNELHLLGGGTDNITKTSHYKFNGSGWTHVSTLPYEFSNGKAIVFNGELHIMGGAGVARNHYKFIDNEWVDMGTMPCSVQYNYPVVYNGKIFVGANNKYYFFDGANWTEYTAQNVSFGSMPAVVYRNELHYLGDKWYKYNGENWDIVGEVPYLTTYGSAVVFRDKIHLIGGDSKDGASSKHYMFRNPRAPLTFVARQVYSETQLFHNDNNTPHWSTSSLRTWCNNSLFNLLPDSLKHTIRYVNKVSDTGYSGQSLETVEDRIWVPSVEELGLESDNIILGQGEPYSVFTDNTSRVKTDTSGTIYPYWTRSSAKNSSSKIYCIGNDGSMNGVNANNNLNNSTKVLFGFCI